MDNTNTKLEKTLEQLGGLGKFQMWVFALNCLAAFMPGLAIVSIYFTGYDPPHRCFVPTCEFPSNKTYDESFLNFTTPYNDIKNAWDSCSVFKNSLTDAIGNDDTRCRAENFKNSLLKENCSEWVFNDSLFKSTIVTEFNLTCNRTWLQGVAGSAYMVGMLIGAIFIGDLSDRIGRRKTLVLALFLLSLGGMIGAASKHYNVFLVSRTVSGIGSTSVFQISFVLVIEYFASKYRNFVGIWISIPYAMGEATVALFAFYIREWRWLQLAISLPPFLLLPYWWLMPESIRWLVSRGKQEEAKEIVKRMSKINNIEISEDTFNSLGMKNGNQVLAVETINSPETVTINHSEERKLVHLLRSSKMRNRTLNLIFCWMVVNLTYYGLSLHASNLSGNMFVNFVSMMLIEIPSYLFAYLILDRLGRKLSMSLTLLLGGIACVISGLIPKDQILLIMVLSLVGKFGISAAFAMIYVFTAELFPTQYRNLGVGTCSTAANVAGTFAPLIASLGKYYKTLPLFIFGGLSLASGVLILLLPETVGTTLPMTLKEAEALGRDEPLFFIPCCTRTKNLKGITPQNIN